MTQHIASSLLDASRLVRNLRGWIDNHNPTVVALVLLGLVALLMLSVAVAIALLSDQPRKVLNRALVGYFPVGGLVLWLLYNGDSKLYLEQIVPLADATVVEGVWSGTGWSFTYPNSIVRRDQLVLAAGRPTRLLLSATQGSQTMRLGCNGPTAIAVAGRYASIAYTPPREQRTQLSCDEGCRGSAVTKGSDSLSYPDKSNSSGSLVVLAGSDFDKWLTLAAQPRVAAARN